MVLELFPERHLYIRSRGVIRGLVLTTGQQATAALGLALLTIWLGVGTAAFMVQATGHSAADQEVARTQAKYERWIADSNARLNSAMVQIDTTNGSVGALAVTLEKRQAALEVLFQGFAGGKSGAVAAAPVAPAPANAMAQIEAVQLDQERLVATAASMAKTRAERLRLAFKLAGLNPESYIGRASASLGGPLIAARDPQALAAVLDVDQGFAARIQQAAGDLADMRALGSAAQDIPFGRPTDVPAESSSFGVRLDPFTHLPAFHSGLDFPGALKTPIYAAAPGVVSYTGPRSGYGS
ncbi:MAG: peptidase, partial [Caulobacteraceae bacterium]|nr:peptidase [Caulobacteraceae bacterium]